MLFADDIVLVAETSEKATKLEDLRVIFESRIKTEYLWCNFSGNEQDDDEDVTIGEDVVVSTKKFKYLGLVIQSDGEFDGDITHHI